MNYYKLQTTLLSALLFLQTKMPDNQDWVDEMEEVSLRFYFVGRVVNLWLSALSYIKSLHWFYGPDLTAGEVSLSAQPIVTEGHTGLSPSQ